MGQQKRLGEGNLKNLDIFRLFPKYFKIISILEELKLKIVDVVLRMWFMEKAKAELQSEGPYRKQRPWHYIKRLVNEHESRSCK